MKYNSDGSIFVTVVGQNDLPHGLFAPSGAMRVTQDAGFGVFAPNGAIRIADSGNGIYSLSGALNGTLSGTSFIPRGMKSQGGNPPVSNWILATGTWNDTGIWDDTALWKDS